jgi:glutathione S-transferase
MEESAVICAWLDQVDGTPRLDAAAGEAWEARRLEALARSMMDGLSVWLRETLRPKNEQSPTTLGHEAERGRRMADAWEQEIGHPLMRGPFNMLQITLACCLGLEARIPDLDWRAGRPKLCEWYDRIASRPSFAATAPPAASSSRTATGKRHA